MGQDDPIEGISGRRQAEGMKHDRFIIGDELKGRLFLNGRQCLAQIDLDPAYLLQILNLQKTDGWNNEFGILPQKKPPNGGGQPFRFQKTPNYHMGIQKIAHSKAQVPDEFLFGRFVERFADFS